MFSLLKTSCNYLPCIVYYAQKYITQGGHTQYKMIKAWTLDTMICIHSRKECCILGNWSPRQKLKLLITRQHFAFLWRTYRSSSPRSEPGSLILSSFQQHNKITDKTEVGHVWHTVQPTELAQIADYHLLVQNTIFTTQVHGLHYWQTTQMLC